MGDSSEKSGDVLVQLRVQTRGTELGESQAAEAHWVHCPIRGVTGLEVCAGCERRVGVRDHDGGRVLECLVPEAHTRERAPAAALDTQVIDVMSADAVCLDPELGLLEASELLTRSGLHAAPVVDDTGVVVGFVSKTDLHPELARTPRDDAPFRHRPLVEDVMTPQVVTLSQRATMGEAIRVMGQARVHRVPVVDAQGQVIGVLSMRDVMRWLATNLERTVPR